MISLMSNLNCDTDELTYKAETDRDVESKLIVTKEVKRWRKDKLGIWDEQIHTTIYKIDKQ